MARAFGIVFIVRMKKIILVGILMAMALDALPAAAQSCEVQQSLWERPRSGKAILAHAPLRQCVQAWLENPSVKLVIHHGAADEAQLRAAELRYWLIGLAVEGEHLELKDDLRQNELMNIEIRELK